MTQGLAASDVTLGSDRYAGQERIVDVIGQLSHAASLDQIAEIVRREARSLTGADGATLVLREGDYCHYADEDALEPLWKGQRFRAACCVSGWVMEHGQAAVIEDISADSRVPLDVYRPTFVESLLMVPIRSRDPVGAIGNYWARPHRATETEIRILQTLADSTAVALENVLLRADLERRVAERTAELEHEIAERRQVEAMLRESRQRFAGVVESAMDAIISIDPAQRIVFFNAAAETMFGWTAAEAIGRPLAELIPARFRLVHARQVREFFASGVTSRRMGALQHLWALRADGEEFPIEATISTVDLAGGPLGTAIIRDISSRVATESALKDSEARLRYVTEAAGIGYWDWDVAADRHEWSDQCRKILGVGPSDPPSYQRFVDSLHPEDRERVVDAVQAALDGHGYDAEFRVRDASGKIRWLHSKGRATLEANGRPRRMGGVIFDVTERKEMEAALRESEARFRSMADAAPAMLWVTERDGWCSFLSQAWYDFTGQTEAQGAGFGWLAAVHPADRDALLADFQAASSDRRAFRHEYRLRRTDGEYRWVLDAARPRLGHDGAFLGYIGSVIDITDRKRAEELVRRSALHDPLTGLPNRALTHEFCEHLLAGCRRGRVQSAVLFVDLDHFKPINDKYGHPVGDAVLEEVARRLRACVRAEDVVGRLGGDEFLVMLSHVHDPGEAGQAARHIVADLGRPYRVGRPGSDELLELTTSPSIGISLFPDHGDDIATLIERSDAAMYQAKASGRADFRFYTGAEPPRA